MLLSSKPSDTPSGVLEENGVSPSKLVFRPVVGVGHTGDRNPMSPELSRLLDDGGPASRNSFSFRFRGNMIGVLKLKSESASEASDVAGAMGGFFEQVAALVADGESITKGRLFEEKDEWWFVSSCCFGFSAVRKPQEERLDGH